jgi:hypothetical protein
VRIVLRKITNLQASRIVALDGEVGKIRDIYFDDISWVVRYLVVATGGWLSGRKVLIFPQAVDLIDRKLRTVSVSLTRERIEASPDIDTDKPVSRQHESELNRYYGYSPYWAGSIQWGTGPMPPPAGPTASDLLELEERRLAGVPLADTHLRSTRELSGYTISALDGAAGHVKDFLFDDETWVVRFLVLETRPWVFGRNLLVSTACVQHVDWAAKSVEVGQTREQIEHSEEFDADCPPPGDLEAALKANPGANGDRLRK